MTANKQLRELAEKAGSGHWYEVGELRYHDDRSGETHGLHHDEDGFIAAANPATVLSLLDENEALQAECEQLRKDAERYRFIRDTEELPMNLMRLDMMGDLLDAAIDTAIQEDNPCQT